MHSVVGGLRDRDAIAGAAEGAEAVLAALGSASDASGDDGRLFSASMAAVVSAMKLVRVRRLVALSAAGVGESRDGTPLAYRLKIASLWRDAFTDLERMEEVVLFSGLDWTLIRPAALTDGPLTGLYRSPRQRPAGARQERFACRRRRADAQIALQRPLHRPHHRGRRLAPPALFARRLITRPGSSTVARVLGMQLSLDFIQKSREKC